MFVVCLLLVVYGVGDMGFIRIVIECVKKSYCVEYFGLGIYVWSVVYWLDVVYLFYLVMMYGFEYLIINECVFNVVVEELIIIVVIVCMISCKLNVLLKVKYNLLSFGDIVMFYLINCLIFS